MFNNSAHGVLDNNQIINRAFKLNRGRILWYCATPIPGWTQAKKFRDLVRNGRHELYQAYFNQAATWSRKNLHPGAYGSVFLNGTADTYLQCLQETALPCQLNDNFTVAAWIRQDAVSTYTAQIAGILNTYQEPGDNNWFLRITGSKLEFGGSTTILSGNVITLGVWYRVVAVMKSGAATIYQNGISVATGTPSIPGTVGRPLVLGADYKSPNHIDARFFTGALNDLSVFNRPFTTEDLYVDYEESKKGYPNAWNWVRPVTYSTTSVSTSIDRSVTSTLNLTQSVGVSGSGVTSRSITSALVFAQSARGFNGTKTVTSSLALGQIVAASKIYKRSLVHTLTFNQAASVVQIRKASNTLTFTQSATANRFKGANNPFALSQGLIVQLSPHNERPNQFLTLSQMLVGSRIHAESPNNIAIFNQVATATKVRNLVAFNAIVFRGVSSSAKILQPSNALLLSQALIQHRVINRSVGNVLGLVQTVVKRAFLGLHPSNTLIFKSTHDRTTEFAGRQEVITIPSVIVTKPNYTVVLEVPSAAITLKRPELGDTEGGLGKILQQRTTTGGLFTYVRRVRSRKLKYKFEISRAKALEFRSYIYNYLSEPMRLTNWKGEIWFGYLVNNPCDIVSKGRSLPSENEIYDIEVEFEGVKIHG